MRTDQFEAQITEERSQGANFGEFIFLNRKGWSPPSAPDLVILGCTLWTQLNADDMEILQWSMTDFKQIKGMTPELYDNLHVRDCRWLEDELSQLVMQTDKKVIVFTHHAPYADGVSDPKFSGPNNPTSSGFVTDLQSHASGVDLEGRKRNRGALLTAPVHTWAFGHTHWCCDFNVVEGNHNVRLVSNQRGYKNGTENHKLPFNKEFVLTL